MTDLRQPAPGACIPRSCFKAVVASAVVAEPAMPEVVVAVTESNGVSSNSAAEASEATNGTQTVSEAAVAEATSEPKLAGNLPPVVKTPDTDQSLESRLRKFYLKLNPERCNDAVKLGLLFEGREAQLNSKLRARYGEDLDSQGLGAPEESSSSSYSDSDGEPDKSGGLPVPSQKLQEVLSKKNGNKKQRINQAPARGMAQRLEGLPPPPRPPPPPPIRMPQALEKMSVPVSGHNVSNGVSVEMSRVAIPSNECKEEADITHGSFTRSADDGADLTPAERLRRLVGTMSQQVAAQPAAALVAAAEAAVAVKTNGACGKRPDLALSDMQARLRRFYMAHNPEKVDDAPKVAKLFTGREADLNERLRARYGGLDLHTISGTVAAPEPAPVTAEESSEESEESSDHG